VTTGAQTTGADRPDHGPVPAAVVVIGAGLIGTSVALALRAQGTQVWLADQDPTAARLAQDIGYPDSSHFSHSVRRFYGLKPRAIFSGSRELAVYRSPAAALRGGAKISVGAT